MLIWTPNVCPLITLAKNIYVIVVSERGIFERERESDMRHMCVMVVVVHVRNSALIFSCNLTDGTSTFECIVIDMNHLYICCCTTINQWLHINIAIVQ